MRIRLVLVWVVFACVVVAQSGANAGINGWTSLGPEGGTIYLVAASPKIPGTVYAAAVGAGLFKSTDGGGSWTALNAGLPSDPLGLFYVSALAIDSKSPSTIYVATIAGNPPVAGIFKSTDGGKSWSAADFGLPSCVTAMSCPPGSDDRLLPVNSLTIDPQNSDTVYAAIRCAPCYGIGVFKTTDGGATWNAAGAGLPPNCCVNVLAIDPQDPNTLYAGATDTIFKSMDGGASWVAVNSGLTADPAQGRHLGVASLAIDPRNSGTVFAGTLLGLFKTDDGGASWRESDSGLVSHFPEYYESRVSSLAIDPQNPHTLYAVFGDGIFKSTDAAVSWNAITSGLPESAGFGRLMAGLLYTLCIDPVNPNTLYVGSEAGGGVIKSTNGGASWKAVNYVLRASFIDGLVLDPQNLGTLYVITDLGLFKTTDGGTSWILVNSGLPGNGIHIAGLAIDPVNSATLYAAAADAAYHWGLYKTIDGGLNWNEVDSEPNLGFVGVLAVDPQSPSTVYAAGTGGVFKSTDGGASWQDTHSPAPIVTTLVFDPNDSGILYAGTTSVWETPNSPGKRDSRVLKTTDGGLTWIAPPDFPSQGGKFPDGVTSLAADPQTQGTVYAATDDWDAVAVALWKSTDGGTSWQDVWPYRFSSLYAIVADPQHAGTIYVASDRGLLESTDGGANWNALGFAPRVWVLALDSQNHTLYAGTPGQGLFAIALAP